MCHKNGVYYSQLKLFQNFFNKLGFVSSSRHILRFHSIYFGSQTIYNNGNKRFCNRAMVSNHYKR
jgi:hypothetical protein